MEYAVLFALLATLVTWGLTAAGAGTVLFFKNTNQKILNLMLGFAAGVMIAASFWSLLQPAIERAEEVSAFPPWSVATVGFLCGALFLWLSDKIVTWAQSRANPLPSATERRSDRLHRVVLLVLSVTLHNIPEGFAVGVAFGVLGQGEWSIEALMGAVTLALGIGLQNFPEGAAVALPLRREGYSRRKSFLIGQASGMVEPIAGVIGALAVIHIESVLPFALAFAAGAMILVAVHELIPECQRNQEAHPYFATMGIVFGFALMMLLDVALGT
ncbi:MAG: ZIP family metal transporter [Clostridia bacterium]|nr:ZIP family metal transporter [Clostridia bacterium]